jgi:hypothetical protein
MFSTATGCAATRKGISSSLQSSAAVPSAIFIVCAVYDEFRSFQKSFDFRAAGSFLLKVLPVYH